MHLYRPQASWSEGDILTDLLREQLTVSWKNHGYFLVLHPGSIVLRLQRASQLLCDYSLLQENVKWHYCYSWDWGSTSPISTQAISDSVSLKLTTVVSHFIHNLVMSDQCFVSQWKLGHIIWLCITHMIYQWPMAEWTESRVWPIGSSSYSGNSTEHSTSLTDALSLCLLPTAI